MIKFILDYDSRRHLYYKEFLKVGLLSVEKRQDYLSVNLMHRIFYGLAPSYLCNFRRVDSSHSHRTRHSIKSFVLPEVKSQGKKSFMYNGARLWNSLPVNIRLIENKDNFKKKCKRYFFKEMELCEQNVFTQ